MPVCALFVCCCFSQCDDVSVVAVVAVDVVLVATYNKERREKASYTSPCHNSQHAIGKHCKPSQLNC